MFEYNNPLTRATGNIMDSAAAAQRYRLSNMQLEEEQRKLDDAASLRAKLAAVKPETTTAILPKVADAGTARQMLGAEILPAQQYTQTPATPAPLTGSLESEMQSQGLAEKPAVDATNFNIPQPEASPIVQAYNEGRVQTTTKEPNYYKVLLQHAQETGNVDLLQKTRKDIVAHAQELIAMGGFSDGIKLMNETLGTNLSNQRAGKFDFIKDADGNTVSIFMEDTARQLMSSGVSPQEAVKQSTVEIEGDTAGKQLAAHITKNPDLTYKEAMMYLGENGLDPSGKAVNRVLENLRKDIATKGYDSIDMGDRVKIIPRDGSAPYYEKKGITPGAAARITINQGGGDEADVTAWAKAIKEGRANLQDVPNRGTVRSRVVKALEGQGGVDYAGNKAENAAYAGSVAQQTKQLGAMGSFVKNIDKQVNRFEQVSKELASFDTRLLNIPLRQVRGRIAGSPNQAKLDMYLTEISSETGKLASGATGSVAELSQGAREKWEKIHDPNLSMKDLLDLLKETKHAGQMRMESVKEQLDETRKGRSGKTSGTAPITTKGGFKVTVVQ